MWSQKPPEAVLEVVYLRIFLGEHMPPDPPSLSMLPHAIISPLYWKILYKTLVKEQVRLDDETTTYQLHHLLTAKGYLISLHRTTLGWTFHGSTYCQLIREANKTKRLTLAQQHTQQL